MNLGQLRAMTEAFDDETEVQVEIPPMMVEVEQDCIGTIYPARRRHADARFNFHRGSATLILSVSR